MDRLPSTLRALGVLLAGVAFLGTIGETVAFAADGLAASASTVPPPSTPEGDRRYRLVLSIVGVVLVLAGLTGLVLARRRVAEAGRALVEAVAGPHRRARRARARQRLGRELTADLTTGDAVHDALGELAPLLGPRGTTHLYSIVATPTELVAQVTVHAPPPHPWTVREDGRWVRPHDPVPPPGSPAERLPRLVRVGATEDDGATVLVDLAHLDGVLSLTGSGDVARDLLALLVHELLSVPGTPPPVAVVDRQGQLPPHPRAVPVMAVADLLDRSRSAPPRAAPAVVAVAAPRPRAPILALPSLPTGPDAMALAALCTPEQGWNAIVVGDVPGAHWRWTMSPDGTADLGLLGIRVTVPVVRP